MGNLDIILRHLFDQLGNEYVIPPKSSNKTLTLGAKYGPEFACLPLKINIGNFIEALDLGADTLVMAGGRGPCRFGYYSQIEETILRNAGFEFKMITLEPPSTSIFKFIEFFKVLAPEKSIWELWKIIKNTFAKIRAMDELEREVLRLRAFEVSLGDTSKAHREALKLIDAARSDDEIESAKIRAFSLINSVEKDDTGNVLKIVIVGEFFMLLEPFSNFDIEEWLGHEGVSVERSVYVSDWISPRPNNLISGVPTSEIEKAAAPYLSHFVGGEGLETIGHVVVGAREGLDGAIHLLPFTCMPEAIAMSVLPKISRELDFPVMTLVIDEQTGKAGFITRLEAFLDLARSRRSQKSPTVYPEEALVS